VATLALALLVVVVSSQRSMDVGAMSRLGSNLLIMFTVGQLGLTLLLAPLQAAMAVDEERQDRSRDLLLLTPMGRGQLLWGKVASRLLSLGGLVLGGLPVLALIGTYGGVAPMQVLSLTVNTALMSVLLAQVATILVIAQRGNPLMAAAGTWAWGAWVTMVSASGLMWDETAWLSPVVAAGNPTAWGLVPLLLWAPAVAVFGWLGPLLFRLATGVEEDDELGLLSPEVWTLHRYRRRTLWLLPLLGGLGLLWAWGAMRMGYDSTHPVLWPLPVVWTLGAALFGVTVLELAGDRLVTLLARARHAVTARRSARGEQRSVTGPPLLWRLFRTRAAGAVRPLTRTALVLWGLGLLATLWMLPPRWDLELLLVPSLSGMALALGVGGLLPLATTAADRDRRRRQLLLLAGRRPYQLVCSHVVHAVVRALPLVLLGGFAFTVLVMLDPPSNPDGEERFLFALGLVLMTLASTAWLAAQSTLVGLLVPTRGVWVAGIAAGFAALFTPTFLAETMDVFRYGRENLAVDLLRLWNPLALHQPRGPDPSWPMFWRAALTHGAVSGLLIAVATWRLRRRDA